jgi:transcriptional regulator with GAF, ATPase, and Fis domain
MSALVTSSFREQCSSDRSRNQIIGESTAIKSVLDKVECVASTDATVLVRGETGTGKELIANAIHDLSSRRERPFIKLNCAAIPFDLLESELFGHEKGSFTGAIAQKIGRFEMADKGTLFLDEIGDIPLGLQPKLLRVLQEKEFERVGSGQTHELDVRLVAATHRNLEDMVKRNEFRSDLYYRLNVFPVELPPLRERREDIVPLMRHFVDMYSRRLRKIIEHIPPEAVSSFVSYSWPGNIRELQNLVERAVILSSDRVLHNPLHKAEVRPIASFSETLRDSERALLVETLESVGWVIAGANGAAAKMGLARTTLLAKMKRLSISKRQRFGISNGPKPTEAPHFRLA